MSTLPLKPFHRYAGADEADASVRMPSDELGANVLNVCVSELLLRLELFTTGEEGPHMYPWATRFAMGYPLPRWQRELKWDNEQKVRFIESIWAGVDVGSHLVNNVHEFEGSGKTLRYREFSQVLLDGQQRLTALEDYVYNRFAVPDAQGVPRFWCELSRAERRRFGTFHFAQATITSYDEELLVRAYNLRALGGTPHEESERASVGFNPVLHAVGDPDVIASRIIALLPKADGSEG
jgi:hypothetical protein